MSTTREQIKVFLDKCDEITNCKFIMAETKIKDLLKSIVNCPELYMLFKHVTQNFDFLSAKRKYLISVSDGVINRNYVILPDTIGERLAFIFCLLAEFDSDSSSFNNFLQRYYPEDGSYYSSYHAFCDQVILSFKSIIAEVYKRELAESSENSVVQSTETLEDSANPALSQKLSEIYLVLAKEKQLLNSSSLPEEEKQAGEMILNEIENAIKAQEISLMGALLSGYNYFSLYNSLDTDNLSSLIETLGQLENLL